MKLPLPRRRTLVLLAGGAVLLLAAAALGRAWLGPVAGAESEEGLVRREDLVMTVEVTGELASVNAVQIGAPPVRDLWDFKISFLAPESAKVAKGQPVIAFDTEPLEKTLEQKKAEFEEASTSIERKRIDVDLQVRVQELALAEAEARLAKARLKADVPAELHGEIEAAEARLEVEEAGREAEILRAKIEAIRAAGAADLRSLASKRDRAGERVRALQADIEALTVRAPREAIVVYKTGWRDEKKKVGDSTWIGEKVLELPDLSEMEARGDVDEADAGLVSVGQAVKLRLESLPDQDLTGTVTAIGRTVRRQSWRIPTKVYKVKIGLDRTDSAIMRPAMRFRGEIETARIPALLVAPREAIFLRPSGPVAWVRRGGSHVETPVSLGRRNRALVEVLAGLAEHDRLSLTDLRPAEPPRVSAPGGKAS